MLFYSLHVATGGQLQPALNVIESNQGLWGFLVLLLVIALVFLLRKKLTITQVSIIVVSAISMTSAISYYYYAVVAIPFLLILHQESKSILVSDKEFSTNDSQDLRDRRINIALWLASVLTLVQLPILIAQESVYTITTAPFIGGVWITCYLYIFYVLVRSSDKSKKLQEKKS
jgi:hypothetical protein